MSTVYLLYLKAITFEKVGRIVFILSFVLSFVFVNNAIYINYFHFLLDFIICTLVSLKYVYVNALL